MKLNTRGFVVLFVAGWLAFTPGAQAGDTESYGETTGRKALSGLANIGTSFLEIPKNMININNRSNFIYGAVGGMAQGMINLGGRIVVGMSDLILAPLPTQAVVYPLYPWDDFETDTSYGPVFRTCSPSENPCPHKQHRQKTSSAMPGYQTSP